LVSRVSPAEANSKKRTGMPGHAPAFFVWCV